MRRFLISINTAAPILIGSISGIVGVALWLKFTVAYTHAVSDFSPDYVAAYALRNNLPLYGESFDKLIVDLLGWEHHNFHPPTFAVLMLPLSYLSYPMAVYIWNFLNLGLYLALIHLNMKWHGVQSSSWRWLSLLLLLWYPFVSNIGLVQTSILLIVLMMASLRALQIGQDWTAGVLLAMAAALKLFPGYLAIYFLMTRRWRALISFCVSLSVVFLVTWQIVGSANVVEYMRYALPEDARQFVASPLNGSIPAVVATLFSEGRWTEPVWHVDAISTLYVAAGGALTIWLMVFSARVVKYGRAVETDLAVLMIVCMLLVSPLTWIYVMPLILTPVIILLTDGLRAERVVAFAVLILCAIPDVHVARYFVEAFRPDLIPWYASVATKFSFFALVLLFWAFRRRIMARTTQYKERWEASGSVDLRAQNCMGRYP